MMQPETGTALHPQLALIGVGQCIGLSRPSVMIEDAEEAVAAAASLVPAHPTAWGRFQPQWQVGDNLACVDKRSTHTHTQHRESP